MEEVVTPDRVMAKLGAETIILPLLQKAVSDGQDLSRKNLSFSRPMKILASVSQIWIITVKS